MALGAAFWQPLGGGGGGSMAVRKNSGANVGTRPRLNLIEGSNVTLTVADDVGDDEVDVTITASPITPTGWRPLPGIGRFTYITVNGGATSSSTLDDAHKGFIDAVHQWYNDNSQSAGDHISWDFGSPITLAGIRMHCLYGTGMSTDFPRGWKVRRSADGTAWTDVATGSATAAGVLETTFTAAAYRHWRIELTTAVTNHWRVNEFEFLVA